MREEFNPLIKSCGTRPDSYRELSGRDLQKRMPPRHHARVWQAPDID
jgi:hypothetical protein